MKTARDATPLDLERRSCTHHDEPGIYCAPCYRAADAVREQKQRAEVRAWRNGGFTAYHAELARYWITTLGPDDALRAAARLGYDDALRAALDATP